MTSPELELVHAFETHDIEGIRRLLDGGVDAAGSYGGKSLVNCLLEMYTRSDRFPEALGIMLDRGGVLDDPVLEPVVMNDAGALRDALTDEPSLLTHRVTLPSAFCSLHDATLLHLAAEYGHGAVARVLLEAGAEVDAPAGVDEHGMNGHTPLFHTVNAHRNRSATVMKLLLEHGADASLRVDGLVWGGGLEWETVFFDVTPISFAQMGLLPQVHRDENEIYENVRVLVGSCGRAMPPLGNVPNRYLSGAQDA